MAPETMSLSLLSAESDSKPRRTESAQPLAPWYTTHTILAREMSWCAVTSTAAATNFSPSRPTTKEVDRSRTESEVHAWVLLCSWDATDSLSSKEASAKSSSKTSTTRPRSACNHLFQTWTLFWTEVPRDVSFFVQTIALFSSKSNPDASLVNLPHPRSSLLFGVPMDQRSLSFVNTVLSSPIDNSNSFAAFPTTFASRAEHGTVLLPPTEPRRICSFTPPSTT
mmetsp:Transcript_3839/g.8374  ORF Transcript_3839/g.8374 Transcript_3839/m.8374 type:complete len:224 (+) Transcript_3839:724-1395(+)